MTQPQIGVDAGAQLPEVHRARHGVLRARLERISDGVGPAVRQKDDHRGTGEARGGRQVPHHLRQPRLLRGDGEDEKIGRLRLRPFGTGRRIGGFGDLEAAPDQESLEPVRPGSGYQTAILARLAGRVYTIERLPDLLVEAEERFRRLGLTNIETRLGDGAAGWPECAPFQGIIVTAAAPSVPTPLTEQLAPGGRLVIPIGDLASQELVILQRGPAGMVERRAGGVRFVPLISRLAFTEEPWT